MYDERESAIEKRIRLLAEKRGWLVIKIEKANRRGVPDRVCFKDGRTVFLEVKTRFGRLRPEQHTCISDLRQHGMEVFVVRSMEEVDAILR